MRGWELVVKALPIPKRKPGPPSVPFGYTVLGTIITQICFLVLDVKKKVKLILMSWWFILAECVEAAHKIHMAQKMTAEQKRNI